MSFARNYKTAAALCAAILLLLTAACATAPKNPQPGQPVAAVDSRPCKTTRNVQSPGPQPASNPPRCANSVDAGKLPATAIGTIMISH